MLVDAHCHFDFPAFDGRRDEILDRCRSLGVDRLVIPGVTRNNWDRVVRTSEACGSADYCLGIHPWYVDAHDASALDELKQRLQARDPRCLGLGECGLDRLRGDLSQQREWFRAQAEIAEELCMPLVVHSVRTHDEVIAELNAARFSGRALIHGFSGSYEQGRKLVSRGCMLGVGGVVTHDRARKTRDAIARLPLESLMLETDAPDMSPEGIAQGENSPEHLPRVLASLAYLRGVSQADLAEQLGSNTRAFFGNPAHWPRIGA